MDMSHTTAKHFKIKHIQNCRYYHILRHIFKKRTKSKQPYKQKLMIHQSIPEHY